MICESFADCIEWKSCQLAKVDKSCMKVQKNTAYCGQHHRDYYLELPKDIQALKYGVDGHVVRGNSQVKCDNLVLTDAYNNVKRAVFVELKGTDVHHAYEQIIMTISLFKEILTKKQYRCYARIIYSGGTQAYSNNDKEKLNNMLRRINGGCKGSFVKLGSRKLDEKLVELV